MLVVGSIIAAVGLITDSSVTVVASMLVSVCMEFHRDVDWNKDNNIRLTNLRGRFHLWWVRFCASRSGWWCATSVWLPLVFGTYIPFTCASDNHACTCANTFPKIKTNYASDPDIHLLTHSLTHSLTHLHTNTLTHTFFVNAFSWFVSELLFVWTQRGQKRSYWNCHNFCGPWTWMIRPMMPTRTRATDSKRNLSQRCACRLALFAGCARAPFSAQKVRATNHKTSDFYTFEQGSVAVRVYSQDLSYVIIKLPVQFEVR